MATNFFELATTLKNLGAKWLSEKEVNITPCNVVCIIKDEGLEIIYFGKISKEYNLNTFFVQKKWQVMIAQADKHPSVSTMVVNDFYLSLP